MVRERTPEGVLEAIRAHRTYASEGPEVRSIRFEESGAIIVKCSECVACHFMSRGMGVRSVVAEQGAEGFKLDLTREGYRLSDWFMVCLEDRNGRRVWSSTIPVRKERKDFQQILEQTFQATPKVRGA